MRTLIQTAHIVQGLDSVVAGGVNSDWISLSKYNHATAILNLTISSGTAVGALTLEQAKDNTGTDAKALSFKKVWVNDDTTDDVPFIETDVVSDTIDIGGAATNQLYILEIDAETLDVDNQFQFLRVNLATVTNGTVDIKFILSSPRFIDGLNYGKSAI